MKTSYLELKVTCECNFQPAEPETYYGPAVPPECEIVSATLEKGRKLDRGQFIDTVGVDVVESLEEEFLQDWLAARGNTGFYSP